MIDIQFCGQTSRVLNLTSRHNQANPEGLQELAPWSNRSVTLLSTESVLGVQDSALDMLQNQQAKAAGGWIDTILNLIPGRKQLASDEPNEEAIKRTHDYLRSALRPASLSLIIWLHRRSSLLGAS